MWVRVGRKSQCTTLSHIRKAVRRFYGVVAKETVTDSILMANVCKTVLANRIDRCDSICRFGSSVLTSSSKSKSKANLENVLLQNPLSATKKGSNQSHLLPTALKHDNI
ncbi:unnamed protein product, partial [Brenthis ino]